MSDKVAVLSKVRKQFGQITALDGLDLNIAKGQLLALLGRNGAGKTTAISLLLGLLRPDQGEVEVLAGNPVSRFVRSRLGAMLQHTELPEQLTVAEHLRLFQSYFPKPRPLAKLIEEIQLQGVLDRRYGQLSGGQKRRVLLAIALAGDPEFLLLDEPTTGLDIDSRRLLWRSVRRVVAEGKTVLLTTHYLEEADALADHIAVIDQGRMTLSGTPAQVKSVYARSLVRFRSKLSIGEIAIIDQVQDVNTSGSFFEVHTHAPEVVLRLLLNQDPTLSDLSVSQTRLEDAFLALTQSQAA